MKHIDKIRERMNRAGMDSLDYFFTRKARATIQKDGIKYEILSIFAPEEGDTSLVIDAIPSYGFQVVSISVDDTWRERTWEKLVRLVYSGTAIAVAYNEHS